MPNPACLDFPVALGVLKPGASFATQSVRLDVNLPTNGPDGQPWTSNREILVQASTNNLLPSYICVPLAGQAANVQADTTNYTNVIAVLQPGDTWPKGGLFYPYDYDLTKYFYSTGNATDFAIGSVNRK